MASLPFCIEVSCLPSGSSPCDIMYLSVIADVMRLKLRLVTICICMEVIEPWWKILLDAVSHSKCFGGIIEMSCSLIRWFKESFCAFAGNATARANVIISNM